MLPKKYECWIIEIYILSFTVNKFVATVDFESETPVDFVQFLRQRTHAQSTQRQEGYRIHERSGDRIQELVCK